MPAELLAKVTVERRVEFWDRVLKAGRGDRQRIAVAEVEGTAVGFAWTGPLRDADNPYAPGDSGELYAINVAPRWWGHGIGAVLLETAHESLAAEGFPRAVLWVVASNIRSRRFYDRAGWLFDGTTREEEDEGFLVPEARYVRRISAPARGSRTRPTP